MEQAPGWALEIVVAPAAREEEPILANLLEFYIYDFSDFFKLELNESARFGYRDLPLYWSEPGRHPLIAAIDGMPSGFALVTRGSRISGDAGVWDMAEFFVMRGQRRRRAGTRIAAEVWRKFPGPWEIRVIETNVAALRFWASAIRDFVGQPVASSRIEKGGAWWRVFSFTA
jgi:predicted acetyltransferase